MKILWREIAWDEYLEWSEKDKKAFKSINNLLKDIERNGVSVGRGRPELLKYESNGSWSREIDKKNRLIYHLTDRGELEILRCKGHYGDH